MKKHIVELDIIRGLCVIGIVMIHSTFWSGEAYVPNFVQSLSLLIDAPAFFFIAGASVATSGTINPLKTIYKILFYFGICVFVYDLIAVLTTFKGGFHNTLAALTLHNFSTPQFPVVGGSYWFVPIFCVVAILCSLILLYFKSISHLIGFGFLLVYAFAWMINFKIKGEFLGIELQYILFYAGLYLLGFWFMAQNLCAIKLGTLLGGLGFVGFVILTFSSKNADILTLQSYKFAPQLPYVLASLLGLGVLLYFYQISARFTSESKSRTTKIASIWRKISKGLEFAGVNAIYFYIAQGFSSSLLLKIAPQISMWWGAKLTLCFCINLALCVGFVWILKICFEKTLLATCIKNK